MRTSTHILRGVAILALVSCGDVRDLRWEYDLIGDRLDDATNVQARIRRGGCLGEIEWEAQWVRGQPGPTPPRLTHGETWGFEVRLLDAACAVRATGCVEVRLPSNMGVVTQVVVQPAPHRLACEDMQVCSDGRCVADVPRDGGMECEECCAEDTCTDGVCIAPVAVTSIMGGAEHSCAIRGGQIWCWGTSTVGEVGNGSLTGVRETPVLIATETDWARVDGQARTTCAVRRSGEVRCWGSNSAGQLGIGSAISGQPTPVAVSSASNYVDVAVGNEHACAVSNTSRLHCWGRNDEFAVSGTGPTTIDVPTPYDDGIAFGVIELGGRYSCGFAGGLFCWGDDSYATLARGGAGANSAVPVSIGGTFRAFAGGTFHSCAVDTADQVVCWGKNLTDGASVEERACGVEADVIVASPVLVPGVLAQDVDASNHTCVLTVDSQVACFGPNQRGQLGDGTTTSNHVPQVIRPPAATGGGWTLVRLGQRHTCAADRAGGLWCWGANDSRQLGLPDANDRLVPERVCFGG